jgi:chromosome segregation ATPase
MTAQETPEYKKIQAQADAAQTAILQTESEIAAANKLIAEKQKSFTDWEANRNWNLGRKPVNSAKVATAQSMMDQLTAQMNELKDQISALKIKLQQQKDYLAAVQLALNAFVDNYNSNIANGATPQVAASVAQQNTKVPSESELEKAGTAVEWYKNPTLWIVVGVILVAVAIFIYIKKRRK